MSKEVKTFKTVDDILEYYGWRDAKKEEKKDADNTEDTIPGAGEDRKTTGDAG